jgi:hypothetical protein
MQRTMPVTREPYLRNRTLGSSFALPDGIKRHRPVCSPFLNLIPQLLPSVALVGSLTVLVAPVEAVVDDVRQVPCHLVGPGSFRQ